VSRWVYFALLAGLGASVGIVNANTVGAGWTVASVVVALGVAAILQVSVGSETQQREYRRTYDASTEATYVALCGSLSDLDYRITTRDADSGKVAFTGGKLGPWIPRLGVECVASVRQIADQESEITIAGHVSGAERQGRGVLLYPEGLTSRAARILDRVEATVITHSVIDATLGEPRDGGPAFRT
jgi:hypothetical protein